MHGSRYIGVLSIEEAVRLTPAELAAKRRDGWLTPVCGGEKDQSDPKDKPAKDEPKKDDEPKDEKTVPLHVVDKERREKRVLQERLDALEAAEEERKAAEMSEVDKANARAEKAEKELADANARAEKAEKRGWIRDAAATAGFTDPADAVARISADDGLEGLEDEKAARDAVKELKNSAPHLVGKKDPDPTLDEVLKDGKRKEPDEETDLTVEQIKQMSPEQVKERLPEVEKVLAAAGGGS